MLFRTKSSKALETAHTNGCLSTGLRSAAVVPARRKRTSVMRSAVGSKGRSLPDKTHSPPTIEARHTAEARRGLRVVHNTVVGMCLITGVRGFARRSLCSGSRMDLGVEAWGPLCTGHVCGRAHTHTSQPQTVEAVASGSRVSHTSQCLCERSRSRSGVHSIAGVRGLRSNEERRSLWSGSRDRSWCGGLGPAVHWLCLRPGANVHGSGGAQKGGGQPAQVAAVPLHKKPTTHSLASWPAASTVQQQPMHREAAAEAGATLCRRHL